MSKNLFKSLMQKSIYTRLETGGCINKDKIVVIHKDITKDL